MNTLQAIILGLLQGFTEFLPISSSAHLVIIPKVFGWEQQSLTFDIFVHAGTLVAIIYFYRNSLKKLFHNILRRNPEGLTYLKNIMLTTIPTLVIYVLVSDKLDTTLESLNVIIITLLLGGIFLIVADIFSKNSNNNTRMKFLDAILIGVGQGASLFRGLSRSGTMLTVGLFLKIDRKILLEYVFVASIPVILGGLFLESYNYIGQPSSESISVLLIGLVSAALSGLLAINIISKYLNKNILIYCGIYRILLSILLWFI